MCPDAHSITLKNTCKFSMQWRNPVFKMTTETDYRYMSINENGDVIGISFIKVYNVGFDRLNSQCVVVV